MKRYRSLIIPMSLTEGDAGVLRWGGKISRLASSRQVTFCHAAEEKGEIPEKVRQKYPWLMNPLEEILKERMESLVRAHWDGGAEIAVKYRVERNASTVFAVLNAVVEEEADLIVVGQAVFGEDLGVRLARKAPCSVMTVPAGAGQDLESILVPTDFSEYSRAALDVAVAFAEAAGLESIDSLHVCDLGQHPHRVTLPEAEIAAFAEEYAREKHGEYVASVDMRGIDLVPHQVAHRNIPAAILAHARSRQSSLIVTGCRGQHAMTAMLLGGNAEDLLRNASIPVIAAKAKGTGRSLLNSLFGI